MNETAEKAKHVIDWGMSLYEKVQRLAFRLPFVKIDRREYLTRKLAPHCTPEELALALEGNPVEVLGKERIHAIARKAALKHVWVTAAFSFCLAIPYNIFIEMSLLCIDIAQFQIMVFIITQKLMYLYGMDKSHAANEKEKANATTIMLMVSAIMIGTHRVTHTLKSVTGSAARKIVLQASTRAGNRLLAINFIRQTCKWLGIEVTKGTVILSFNIIVSVLCCLISGLITFWLLYPMCQRLMTHFEQKE